MKLLFNYFSKVFKRANFWLILPFTLISLILVIIPLIIIVVYALAPTHSDGEVLSVSDNFAVFNSLVGEAIWRSLWVSILATLFCLLIAYPFAYFLSFSRSKVFKTVILVIVTAPIWSSFLIKLIGLKSLLDILNGGANSTFGVGYTLIGLVYIYIPFAIIPIYTVLDQLPKNLINASNDLNHNQFETFWKVVLPYTRVGLMSAIIMVFLPSFTTVAVSQFLDNSNDNAMIGDINYQQGINGLDSSLSLARSSAISLVISIIMFSVYGFIVLVPKLYAIVRSNNKKHAFVQEFKWVNTLSNKVKDKVKLYKTKKQQKGVVNA